MVENKKTISKEQLKQKECLEHAKVWIQQQIIQLSADEQNIQIIKYLQLIQNQYLSRFCDCSKYDLLDVINGLKNCLKWRLNNSLYNILEYQYPEWELVQNAYPHGYHKSSKQGNPIFIQRLGFLDIEKMKQSTTKERFLRRCFQSFEHSIQVRYPHLSKLYNKQIDQTIIILDLKELSLLSDNRDLLYILNTVATITSQYYPGNTHSIYIINVPSLFTSTWQLLKQSFPSKLIQTVNILNQNYLSTLSEIIDIQDIPSFLGGECKCSKNQIKQKLNTPYNQLDIELTLYCK